MNFGRRFNWLNREKIVLVVGLIALLGGALLPWYRLPPQVLETFGSNLIAANIGRMITAFLVIIVCCRVALYRIDRVARLHLWSGLIAALLFPYFIVTWYPTIGFIAETYYDQNQRVTQHIERNFPHVQANWKQNIVLDKPTQIRSRIYLSIRNIGFFQMSSWDKVFIEGLGYSNSFFIFIGRGWGLTVTGLVITLIGLYLGLGERKFEFFWIDMGKFLPGAMLLMAIIVLSMILPNIINRHLDTLFAKGEYRQVVLGSKIVALWYPPLGGNEELLKRLAEAQFYANQPEERDLMAFTKGLELYREGNLLQAENYLQQSLNIQPLSYLVRGYLATTKLNLATDYFNSPKRSYVLERHNRPSEFSRPKAPDYAHNYESPRNPNNPDKLNSPHNPNNPNPRKSGRTLNMIEESLQVFPDNLEALYYLMLFRAINGELEESAKAAKQIIELQQYFQESNPSLLGQAYLHLAWADYHDDNIAAAWKRYRQSIDPRAWNKSIEVEE